MTTTHAKLTQYLGEAHALEANLVQTLSAHLAMTPAGAYRDLLALHRDQTRTHARVLQVRLRELGAGQSPLAAGLGLAQTIAGQAIALGKAPLDLVRGGSREEKLLKNAKDEVASEALEIATYDALEALALALGDETTAAIAVLHREQEEAMLLALRALLPQLTAEVVGVELIGPSIPEPPPTGPPRGNRPRRGTTAQRA
jgi:ferritin-like metal-binding protein YciE